MKAANLTQKQLAVKLGVNQPMVSYLLNPKSNPRLNTLRALSRAMGISIDTLASAYDEKASPDTGEKSSGGDEDSSDI